MERGVYYVEVLEPRAIEGAGAEFECPSFVQLDVPKSIVISTSDLVEERERGLCDRPSLEWVTPDASKSAGPLAYIVEDYGPPGIMTNGIVIGSEGCRTYFAADLLVREGYGLVTPEMLAIAQKEPEAFRVLFQVGEAKCVTGGASYEGTFCDRVFQAKVTRFDPEPTADSN
jgi:hypothetical protein